MHANEKLNAMYSCLGNDDLHTANAYALEVLQSDVESAPAWYVVGEHHLRLGNFEAAETSFGCVTTLSPKSSEAWSRLSESMYRQDKFDEALKACVQAISLEPSIENYAAYFRFEDRVKTSESREKILALLLQTLSEEPDSAEHYLLLSRFYIDIQEYEKASNAYLMATACGNATLQILREYGRFLYEIGKLEKAAKVFMELTEKEPDEAWNWLVLGGCYFRAANWNLSIEANLKVLELDPDIDGAKLNLAMAYASLEQYEEAANHLEDIVNGSNPRFPRNSIQYLGAVAQYQYCKRYLGEMLSFSEDQMSVLSHLEEVNDRLEVKITPFTLLPALDSPKIQRLACKSAMDTSLVSRKELHHVDKPDGRIRVGWFGSDFYDHATMYLMRGVFRHYDKEKFDFRIYDYGNKKDEMTYDVILSVDEYYDFDGTDDHEIIELARSHDLDIAIDLKGYTGGGKTVMFAAGLAPVQIFYLGYPGTSGRDFMDYMIADSITIPDEFREHYSEKIMFMPASYQPNDSERLKEWRDTTREEWGLDPDSFVFASFNQVYKVCKDEVRVWAQLLTEVEGSQLWFYCSGNSAYRNRIKSNVIREFAEHGISEERLVFAYGAPIDEHLSRLRHADVFLDTFKVNGHTTVSDALFAGVPVVTKPGEQFAARVGASLVTAAGCSELVASSEEEYYRLALKLATDKSYLTKIKSKLSSIKTSSLYDSFQYVRDLEQMFEKSVVMSRQGLQSQDIRL